MKPLSREQLIKILTSVSQASIGHSDTCSSSRNGECYCAHGDRHELRDRVRNALRAESPELAAQISALEEVEKAKAAFNAAYENDRRQSREPSVAVETARNALVSAQLRLQSIRSAR